MYDYYKGYLIREGTEGIDGARLRELYEAVGWCNTSLPAWQNEKFEIAMKNSVWAFTVWDKDILIGMVRVVSDRVMVASIQDLIILEKVEYIEELKHGVIIRGNTTIRKYEPHKKYNKYTQMEGQVAMDVFVQKGVYPEDMLENIGDEISPN